MTHNHLNEAIFYLADQHVHCLYSQPAALVSALKAALTSTWARHQNPSATDKGPLPMQDRFLKWLWVDRSDQMACGKRSRAASHVGIVQ